MAIKYLAGNRITGTNSDRTGLASGVTDYINDGTLWLELVTNDIYKWDKAADGWELVTGNTVAENLSNKTFTDYCKVSQVSTPSGTVGADVGVIYAKSDGKAYWKFENNSEVDLTVGASANTLVGLSDTTIGGITLAHGHILVYNAGGTAKWLNKPLGGATGTTASLDEAGLLGVTALTVLTDLDMTAGDKTIFDTVGANTITFAASGTQTTFPGNMTVSGNFTVNGTTTTINTTNSVITDNLIELNNTASSNANDSGIIIERGSTGDNAIFAWIELTDKFMVGTTTATGTGTGNLTITAAPFQASAITGTTGTFTGLLTTNNKLLIDRADSALTLSADGQLLHMDALTFTDGTTSASGTAAQNYASVNLDQVTLAATNASVTTTRAATLNIVGAPAVGGSNSYAITNSYALYVAGGASHFVGAITAASSITATGTIVATNAATVGTTLAVSGAATFNGAVTLGNATADDIIITGLVAAHVLPKTDDTFDLGGSSNEWRNLYVDGIAYIDQLDTGVIIPGPVLTGDILLGEDAVIIFEGATDNANETTLTVVDPTADRVISLPDASDTLVGKNTTDTLTLKTLTAPKFANAGFIADANGNELLVFNTTGSAEQHFAMTNAANIAGSVIGPLFAAVGDDTNVALRLSGKGTGASVVIEGGATGACIEFNTKYTGTNPAIGNESARLYLKEVDANNNALAVRIFKANAYQEVEITSPKAICGECGSTDGAKDPTYDFSRSMMVVELWCGHAYEVPMTGWNMVS